MITADMLHDALFDGLDNEIRSKIGDVLARVQWNHGLPQPEHIVPVIHKVLGVLAGLPGEHWIPDDMKEV